MNKFYKNQYRIVTMLVLTLLFQIVAPVASGNVFAAKVKGEEFQISHTRVDEENNKVAIDWDFKLQYGDEAKEYMPNYQGDFTLEKGQSGDLVARDGTVIGAYKVKEEGVITATIKSAKEITGLPEVNEATTPGAVFVSLDYKGSMELDLVKELPLSLLGAPSVMGVGTDLGNIFTAVRIKMDGEDLPVGPAIELTKDTKLRIEFDWAVDRPVVAGDYTTTTLPEGIKLFRDEIGDITSKINGVDVTIATYELDKASNTLKMIFNDVLKDEAQSSGDVWVDFEFDLSKFESDTTQRIQFERPVDKEFTIKIKPKHSGSLIKKTGRANATLNASEITWTVDINTNLDSIDNAVVTDFLPAGLELVGDIVIYNLIVGYNGNLEEGTRAKEDQRQFDVALGNINSAYRIIYKTKITGDRQDSYTNTANIKGDRADGGVDEPSQDTVITPTGKAIEKFDGTLDKPENPKEITWKIQANVSDSVIDGAKISDKLVEGLVLQEGSLMIYHLDKNLKRGAPVTQIPGETVKYDKDTGDLLIDLGNINSPYEIEYVTDIIYGEDLDTDYNKTVLVENTAILINGNEAELGRDTGTASIKRGEPSSKKGTKNISTGLKKIDWVIKVNETEDTLYDVWIEDQSGPGITLIGEPILKDKDGTTLTKGEHYTLQKPGDDGYDFKIILIPNEITSSYTVEYSTKINNLNQTKFINKARVSWIPGSKGPGTGTTNRIYKDVTKEAGATVGDTYSKVKKGINYVEKTMDWEISLGFYKGETTELVITDTFPNNGLVLDPTSLNITYAGGELVSPGDYTVLPIGGSYGKGFEITFNGKYENNAMSIKYTTSFDPDYAGFIANVATDRKYKNQAVIRGFTEYDGVKNPIVDKTVEADQTIRKEAFDNGKKVGKLNREAREISWDIYVNYMEKDLRGSPFVVTDTLSPGQSFDPASLVVEKYTINETGGGWGEGATVPAANYTVEETAEGVTPKGFTLRFTDGIEERYVIRFKTNIDGISKKEYTNTATVTGGNEITDKVTYKDYDNFLIKKAVGPDGNKIEEGHRVWIDDQVDWELKINESLSDIDPGAKIVDMIGSTLIYVEGSVKIFDKNGFEVENDKYEVLAVAENGKTKLTITFKERITERYTVKYSTVVATAEGSITNSAKFNGDEITSDKTEDVELTIRQSSGGSGAGISSKGSIVINKVDEKGLPITVPAKFEIYYQLNGNKRLVGGKNHETVNGKIEINGLNFRTYYIKEIKEPEGFEFDENAEPIKVVLNKAAGASNINAHIETIKNTHIKTQITANKVWVNGPKDKPDIDLQLYRKIDNGTAEAVGLPVTLKGGVTGVRKTTNEWTDLDLTNNAGENYTYTVDEVSVPSGYKKTLDGLTVTNTFQIEERDVTVNKVWSGGPAIKPKIELQLYRDNEMVVGKSVELLPGKLNHTWTGLDKTDASGKEYIYTVQEVNVADYQATYNGLTVTNTYVSPKTTITGKKIWDGGPKPDIELKLFRNNVELAEKRITLVSGTTEYTWTDLDLNDGAGKAYEYRIDEVSIPSEYGKANTDALTITNTYKSLLTDIIGSKIWVGGPEEKPTIELELYRNGITTGKYGKLKDGATTYTWKDLEQTDHDTGIDYTYTVKEVGKPENYTKEEEGLTVTNTYVSPKTEVTGTKVWVNGPSNKPTIEFQLYRTLPNIAPEAVGDPVKLENGTTEHTWKDLDKTNAKGEVYVYTVDEVEIPDNYAKSSSVDGLTITNTYIIPETSIKGTKVWVNGPAKKPTIELQLYKDGQVLGDPVELENGLTEYIWEDLDLTDEAGRAYKYTIQEVNTPENYTKKEEGLTVTNTYTSPKIDVTGIKEWKGGPSTKPTIELQLYRNGEVFGKPVGLANGTFTHTWIDLDEKDQDGIDYIYTIDEVAVPYRYTKTALDDGLRILNTYRPPVDPGEPGGGGPGPKDPTDPDSPDPIDPVDPENPDNPDPTAPVDPDNPDPTQPTEPDRPTPTDPPRYTPTQTPDPNDPNSPDEFILIDEDGVPIGKYTKKENPDGTIIYIDEDGIPLGGGKKPDPDSSPGLRGESVPKTGDEMPVLPLAILFIVSLFSAVGLLIFKKKRYN